MNELNKKSEICKVVKKVKGQTNLARLIGVSAQCVQLMVAKNWVSPKQCLKIEALKLSTRKKLNPWIFDKRYLNEALKILG